MNLYLRTLLQFVAIVLFQVIILNHIHFGGYVNPYLYILPILMLSYETPGWLLLITSFLLGYSIDIFTSTPGMHTAATVFTGFLRPTVIRIVLQKQDADPGAYPSIRLMGFRNFFIYSVLLVFFHHTSLFFIEVFSFADIALTLMRSGLSTVFTIALIIITQYLFYSKP